MHPGHLGNTLKQGDWSCRDVPVRGGGARANGVAKHVVPTVECFRTAVRFRPPPPLRRTTAPARGRFSLRGRRKCRRAHASAARLPSSRGPRAVTNVRCSGRFRRVSPPSSGKAARTTRTRPASNEIVFDDLPTLCGIFCPGAPQKSRRRGRKGCSRLAQRPLPPEHRLPFRLARRMRTIPATIPVEHAPMKPRCLGCSGDRSPVAVFPRLDRAMSITPPWFEATLATCAAQSPVFSARCSQFQVRSFRG